MTRADQELLDRLLEPIRAADARRHGLRVAVEAARSRPGETRRLLVAQEVDGVWMAGLKEAGLWGDVPAPLREDLGEIARFRLATHLLQERAFAIVAAALDAAGVEHVAFKGLHLRRVLYRDPAQRPMVDIDVLVPRARRDDALRAIAAAGFTGTPSPATVSHEIALRGHGIELDVHWAVLRPGRSRIDLGERMLAGRVREGDIWVPSDAVTLALMLVHPVLTEHATYRLMRAVDVNRWVRSRAVRWDEVLGLLRETGLKTAAWVMCTWSRRWFGTPVPETVLSALAPGPARRGYLDAWLRADPAQRYAAHPLLVRGGFGLALQDDLGGAARALMRLAEARLSRAADGDAVAGALAAAAAASASP